MALRHACAAGCAGVAIRLEKKNPGVWGLQAPGVESQPEEADGPSVATDCYRFISAAQFAGGRAVTGDSRRSESSGTRSRRQSQRATGLVCQQGGCYLVNRTFVARARRFAPGRARGTLSGVADWPSPCQILPIGDPVLAGPTQ
jgi:hypothetical protein